jgi:hypothetical protein
MCDFDNIDIWGPFIVEEGEPQIAIQFNDIMPTRVEFSTSNK